MPVALKLQHRVHHVFQRFGASNRTVFGDVANQKNGCSAFFGIFHEFGGALPHLRNAACPRLNEGRGHGLNGVNNQDSRVKFFDLPKQIGRCVFGQNVAIIAFGFHAFGPHFYLLLAFFTRYIQHFIFGERQANL